MLIREGGYYRARNESVHGPIYRDLEQKDGFQWTCADGSDRWTTEGGRSNGIHEFDNDMDLISEVYVSDTPPVPHQAPIPEREAEYRKVLLDAAMQQFAIVTRRDNDGYVEMTTAAHAFELANEFLAELKRRDGGE